ncbi:hypothetical protein AVEN_72728-1 [Araneus ventricosus]|uniref:Uncharacterized protein n=1 Tax=Araneus ventricosus TaxID=182803 RepID=A0A4Y2DRJ2_ARAVE|nr:hypothetical protein AVEN_72728-1 [Araneus ventricosus]
MPPWKDFEGGTGPHSCEVRGNQANPAQPARRRAAFPNRALHLPVRRASALGHWWGSRGALVSGSGPALPISFKSQNRESDEVLSLLIAQTVESRLWKIVLICAANLQIMNPA